MDGEINEWIYRERNYDLYLAFSRGHDIGRLGIAVDDAFNVRLF